MKSTKVNRTWPCISAAPGMKMKHIAVLVYRGFLFSSIFGICSASPVLHPDIWNHDGMKGGSILHLHEFNDDHRSPSSGGGAQSTQTGTVGVRRNTGERDNPQRTYEMDTDNVSFEPAYENTVNPFLSHLEQAWKLKPIRHKFMRKKILQAAGMSPEQQRKVSRINSHADELYGPLPMDPNRPHFVESKETGDETVEENRAFGNEEKDLGDMLHVLLSPDY